MTGLWFQLVYKELCFTATKSVGGKTSREKNSNKKKHLKNSQYYVALYLGCGLETEI